MLKFSTINKLHGKPELTNANSNNYINRFKFEMRYIKLNNSIIIIVHLKRIWLHKNTLLPGILHIKPN
jgi:hypothetical protein